MKKLLTTLAWGLTCVATTSAQTPIRLGQPVAIHETSTIATTGAAQKLPSTQSPETLPPPAHAPNGTIKSPPPVVNYLPASLGPPILSANEVASLRPITAGTNVGAYSSGGVDGGAWGGNGACDSFLSGFWVNKSLLMLETKGFRVPPLVTASPVGTPAAVEGVLGRPSTTVVFGDQYVNGDIHTGFEMRGGYWFDNDKTMGVDIGGFYRGRGNDNATFSSLGNPGLFQPFFDVTNNVGAALPVALIDPAIAPTPLLIGAVNIDASTDLSGLDLNYHHGILLGCPVRRELMIGYRYLRLHDVLGIRADVTSTDPNALLGIPFGATLSSYDRFETKNIFNGVQLGYASEFRHGPFAIGWQSKVGLGTVGRYAFINGVSTLRRANGAVTRVPGGVYAQDSNRTNFSDHDFAVVPEVLANLSYDVTPNIRFIAGYRFLYWSRVMRPGDQIDLGLSAIPPAAAGARPAFLNDTTDFWAHGANIGIECRY